MRNGKVEVRNGCLRYFQKSLGCHFEFLFNQSHQCRHAVEAIALLDGLHLAAARAPQAATAEAEGAASTPPPVWAQC